MSVSSVTTANFGIHRAVIPAAGLGTRLRPLTYAFPKELLPVGRKPVLAHIAAELRGAGITHTLFIVSERKPQIRAFFGEEYREEGEPEETRPALRCEYVVQKAQRGLGDALLCAQEWAGQDDFVVAFGDCLIEAPDPAAPLRRLIATHVAHRAAATVLVETVPKEKVGRYGILAPESSLKEIAGAPFAAADIVEKPDPADAPSNQAVAARYVLTPEIFPALRNAATDKAGELNLTDSVRALRRAGRPLWAVPLRPGEARRDIGNFESFFAAFVRAALCDPDYGDSVRRACAETEGT